MKTRPDYGRVHEVLGIARDAGGWSFAPARVELAPGAIASGAAFEFFLATHRPEVLGLLPEPGTDAIWARASIEALFGVRSLPTDERQEKSLMQFGFCASRQGELAVPFEASDYYGKSALSFSEAVGAPVIESIEEAFWKLVASNRKLVTYRDRTLHLGALVWMEYGCTNGKLFLEYPPDEEDNAPPPPVDPKREALAEAIHFLKAIGHERPGTTCREPGCDRGTVQASVFCRQHHFEAVMGRPIPPELA